MKTERSDVQLRSENKSKPMNEPNHNAYYYMLSAEVFRFSLKSVINHKYLFF